MENIVATLNPERKYVILKQQDDLLFLGSLIQRLNSGDIKVVLITLKNTAPQDEAAAVVILSDVGGTIMEIQFQQINDRVSPSIFLKLRDTDTMMPLQSTSHLDETVTKLCNTDSRSRPHYATYTSTDLLIMIVSKQRAGQSFMLQSTGLANRGTLHECINEWRTRIFSLK